MERLLSVRMGETAAAAAVATGLGGLWFFLSSLAILEGTEAARAYVVAPAILVALGSVVAAALALAPRETRVVASIEAGACVAGLANLVVAATSSGWSGVVLLMIGIPPALLLVGAVCAVFELSRSRIRHGTQRTSTSH